MPPFSMKTIRGVYHNLKDSEYMFGVGEVRFYFSSYFYQQKFISTFLDERDRFNRSLNNIYKNKFGLIGDNLAWLRLYCLIEKRGFYIVMNGVEVTCPEDLRFVVTPICKKSLDE